MKKHVHIVFCQHSVETSVVGVYEDLAKAERIVKTYEEDLDDDSDFEYYIETCFLE